MGALMRAAQTSNIAVNIFACAVIRICLQVGLCVILLNQEEEEEESEECHGGFVALMSSIPPHPPTPSIVNPGLITKNHC